MKLLGLLLIITTGLGLGLIYTRRLRQRVDELCRIERLLDVLHDRLLYSAQPLATLWHSLAREDVFARYFLVREVEKLLCKGESFYTSFSRAIAEMADGGHLIPAAAVLLTELGGALGHSGLDQQARLIRQCAERLKKERQMAYQF